MRKDAGLNGDLDRIPQLAWLLFLKAFDGLEENREVTDDELPPRDRGAVPLARLGGRPERTHRRRAAHFRQRQAAAVPARPHRHRQHTIHVTCSPPCSRRPTTGCCPATCCATSSTRSTRSTSRPPTTSTRWRTCTSRCCAKCATLPATQASSTRRGRSSGSWSSRSTRKLGEVVLDPACGTGGFLVEALEHLQPEVDTVEQLRDAARQPSRHREEAAAVPARDDEPRAARRRPAEHHPRQRARRSITQIGKARARRRGPHQPAVRRRGGEDASRPTSRPTSRRPRRPGCSCSS